MPRIGGLNSEVTAWWRQLVPTPAAALIALFVCVVVPSVPIALQIDANPKFSPVDESAHYDYVNRVAEGEIPRQGERLMPSTLREIACKGNSYVVQEIPPCSARGLQPEQFPGRGYQYEALHPPVYHAITVVFRWPVQHVLGVSDRLNATRAVGIAWLVAGLLLTWAAGRLMGVSPLRLGAVLLAARRRAVGDLLSRNGLHGCDRCDRGWGGCARRGVGLLA